MAKGEAALRAVIDDPSSDPARREYADRCDDPPRAVMIRWQLEATQQLRAGQSGWSKPANEAEALIREHGERWARPVAGMVDSYSFHRGFVEEIGIDAAKFVSTATQLFAKAPIRHLNLKGAAAVATELFALSGLDQIVSLNLSRNGFHDEATIALSESEHLGALAWLSLAFNQVGRVGIEAMAASDRLPVLAYVNLNGNPSGNLGEEIGVDGASGDVLSTGPSKLAVELEEQFGRRTWFRALQYGQRNSIPLRGEF